MPITCDVWVWCWTSVYHSAFSSLTLLMRPENKQKIFVPSCSAFFTPRIKKFPWKVCFNLILTWDKLTHSFDLIRVIPRFFRYKLLFNQHTRRMLLTLPSSHATSSSENAFFSRFDFYRLTECDGKISQRVESWSGKINLFKKKPISQRGCAYELLWQRRHNNNNNNKIVDNFVGGLGI